MKTSSRYLWLLCLRTYSSVAFSLLGKGVAWKILSTHTLRDYVNRQLHKAIVRGDERLVERILEQGLWTLNEPFIDRAPIEEGVRSQRNLTPLHVASASGQFEVVELLLSLGAHARSKTNWNITPMHMGAICKHAHIVAELADAGGDLLDTLPCLSRYAEDDPYCPTSIQILKDHGIEYVGDENRQYRARRDRARLKRTTHPPLVSQTVRSRL